MNKKLKEFYKLTIGRNLAHDFDTEYAENFAKLIIRECVDTLDQQYVTISDDADPEDNKTWIGAIMNTTVDGCKRRILSNFGVEE